MSPNVNGAAFAPMIDTSAPSAPSVIAWPSVSIGGMTLMVKWHFGAVVEMSRRGYGMTDLKTDNPRSLWAHMELFSILVAPIFRAQGQVPPSAEFWCGQLGETNALYFAIQTAINAAFLLVNPLKQTQPASTAGATETQTQNQTQ